MDEYIQKCPSFQEIIVYDFNIKDGGIGDYLKFLMMTLSNCMDNNRRFYCIKNIAKICIK